MRSKNCPFFYLFFSTSLPTATIVVRGRFLAHPKTLSPVRLLLQPPFIMYWVGKEWGGVGVVCCSVSVVPARLCKVLSWYVATTIPPPPFSGAWHNFFVRRGGYRDCLHHPSHTPCDGALRERWQAGRREVGVGVGDPTLDIRWDSARGPGWVHRAGDSG